MKESFQIEGNRWRRKTLQEEGGVEKALGLRDGAELDVVSVVARMSE